MQQHEGHYAKKTVRIMLNRERHNICYHSYVESKKYNKLINITNSRLRETKLLVTNGKREGRRGKIPVEV